MKALQGKVQRHKNGENISKKNPQIPDNLAKRSQNPKKNCRDFLIPRIFVRFFQSNYPSKF